MHSTRYFSVPGTPAVAVILIVFINLLTAESSDECGQRGMGPLALIVGGVDAAEGEFPWHVGVYRSSNNYNICGGTIISTTFVISAAHCFWDEPSEKLKSSSLYQVAAGKNRRSWTPPEASTQISDVAEISVPRRYKGRRSHQQHDIAILRLSNALNWTLCVKPVCMDWTERRDEGIELLPGVRGTVAGWGVASNGTSSEILQKADMPVADYEVCYNGLNDELKRFFTADKFCAGYVNRSQSVCPGDSGDGLVFATGNKYYLRGIVSLSFKPSDNKDRCYSKYYTGFTDVSRFVPWIKTLVTTPTTTVTGCPLLTSPSVRVRCSLDGRDVDCGTAPISVGTQAFLECSPGYKSPRGRAIGVFTTCNSRGQWFPKPLTCEHIIEPTPTSTVSGCPLLSSPSVRVRCSRNGNEVDCGNAPVPSGTKAFVECSPGYKPSQGISAGSFTTCIHRRRWYPKPLTCEHIGDA